MLKLFLLIFVSFLPSQNLKTAENHAIYMSMCQISYNSKTKNIEIGIKVFIDDLEKALTTLYKKPSIGLNTPSELGQADEYIRNYMQKSIQLRIDNKNLIPIWVGKEYEKGEVMWCYFEIKQGNMPKKIWLQNTIFTEIYPKQNNIVQVQIGKSKKNLLLSKDETEGTLTF